MKPENKYYQQYLDYIKNTGGKPSICQFDDDWEPIGPKLRKDLKEAGLIYEFNGCVYNSNGQ